MAGFTDYLEDKLLDFIFGNDTFSAPTNIYVGLFTTQPTGDTNNGVEASGNAYARVEIDNTFWSSSASGTISNALAIEFPAPTPASWGIVEAFGLFDASTDGNLLLWAPLTNSITADVEAIIRFDVGNLEIELD